MSTENDQSAKDNTPAGRAARRSGWEQGLVTSQRTRVGERRWDGVSKP